MGSNLTKEQIDIQKAAREFAEGELRPVARDLDAREAFDDRLWKKAAELGFLAVFVDEQYGGLGLGYLEQCLIVEEFARVDLGIAHALESTFFGTQLIQLAGNEKQKQEYLPPVCRGEMRMGVAITEPDAGSDVTAVTTEAIKDRGSTMSSTETRSSSPTPPKALLAPVGTGDRYAEFKPELPLQTLYDVQGWWVASSNRATNTPFIVTHAGGVDTVRVDQTKNNGMWVKIGTYTFRGDSADRVVVSNAATTGQYVVADAVRVLSYDPGATSAEPSAQVPRVMSLMQNYPNPFNPVTLIRFALPAGGDVSLKIFDQLGREVTTLVSGHMPAGDHSVHWDAGGHASGVYFCRLVGSGEPAVRKMMVLR